MTGRISIIFALFFLFSTTQAFSSKLEVGPTKHFKSIQTAIEAAASGDKVLIDSGEYDEVIDLQKPLQLIGVGTGADGVVVKGPGTVLRIRGLQKGAIQNITFRSRERSSQPLVHISKTSNRFTLENVIFDGASLGEVGVVVDTNSAPVFTKVLTRRFAQIGWKVINSAKPEINSSIFKDNNNTSLAFSGDAGAKISRCQFAESKGGAITALDRSQLSIIKTIFSGQDFAFQSGGRSKIVLQNSVITTTSQPSTIADQSTVSITNTTFADNSNGGLSTADNSVLILQNATFRNNAKFGLDAVGRSNLKLTNVFFEGDGEAGLIVGEATTLSATGCSFKSLDTGLVANTEEKKKQLISANVFIGCKRALVLAGDTSISVVKSRFTGSGTGIDATENASISVNGTEFTGSGEFAISVKDKAELVVDKSQFNKGRGGVFIDGNGSIKLNGNRWQGLTGRLVEAQGKGLIQSKMDIHEDLSHGMIFRGSSIGQFTSCTANNISSSWLKGEGRSVLTVKDSKIKKADVAIEMTDESSLTGGKNTFTGCRTAALLATAKAEVFIDNDKFISNTVAVKGDQEDGTSGIQIKRANFSGQGQKTLSIKGSGKVAVSESVFDEEKIPVEVSGNASVTITKPGFDELQPGGVSVYGNGHLTITDAVFNGFDQSLFSARDASTLTLEKVRLSGGKGKVVDASDQATVVFVDCQLKSIDGAAIVVADKVTAVLTKTSIADTDLPIAIGENTTVRLNDVEIKESRQGIRLEGHANLEVQGIKISGPKKYGMYLDSSGVIKIHDAEIQSGDIGVAVLKESKSIFSGLKISAPTIGVEVSDKAQCLITDLQIDKSKIGIVSKDKSFLSVQKGKMSNTGKAVVAKGAAEADIDELFVKYSEEGILLSENSVLSISGSDIAAAGTGIAVLDNARISGEGTVVRVKKVGLSLDNQANSGLKSFGVYLTSSKGVGLTTKGQPTGLIDGFLVEGGRVGFELKASIPLVLQNIRFLANKEAGFSFTGNGFIEIHDGTIEGNKKGIVIGEKARPAISGLTCIKCETGFIITGDAKPSLVDCGVSESKNGMLINENSMPEIAGFRAKDGTGFGSGVIYKDSAAGTLKEPQIGGDNIFGVVIYDNAAPYIFGSTEVGYIRDAKDGIGVFGLGKPVIYSLLIEDNVRNGVVLEGKKKTEQPVSASISGCRIRSQMGGAGIYVGKNAKAYVLGLHRDDVKIPQISNYYKNIIRSNLTGIVVAENGDALIDGNIIENNGTGIEAKKDAFASIHRNHIRDSKFIEMDKGGVGIFIREKAGVSITDHNRIYKNRAAAILLTTKNDKIHIENNEIYDNVNLPSGSNLDVNTMGAVMVNGTLKMKFFSNYLHDNKSAGVLVTSAVETEFRNNLFERNQRAGLHVEYSRKFLVENNTFIGVKFNDIGLLLGRNVSNGNIKKFSFQNNVLSKFSIAFNAIERITKINKKWFIRRNAIHNCELENGPNLPDLLKNYKIDPVFSDPNGDGTVAFTPEPGSNICNNSKIYDWGDSRYCGAFRCREEQSQADEVKVAIVSPETDGDIVPRKLAFKANVMIPEEKDIASWELYVNGNLLKQSRGIKVVKSQINDGAGASIQTAISSLPYGKSLIRLEVNSSKGEQWTAERMVYTASCSETHKRWVILIGISDYAEEGGVPDLTYAAADALSLREVLNRRSYYSPYQDVEVITLTDEQATREGLRQVLFGKIAPCVRADDEVFIFFAGHGSVEKDRFFLVMHDSDLNKLELTGYEMQELRDVIRYNIKSDNIFMMFDACHSGGVNLERRPANALNSHLTELTSTMENVNIMTASQGSEVSFEFPDCCLKKENGKCVSDSPFKGEGHGAFTCTLLHALTGYDVEDEKKRNMSFQDITSYVEHWLPQITEQQQHPQVLSNAKNSLNVTTIPTVY